MRLAYLIEDLRSRLADKYVGWTQSTAMRPVPVLLAIPVKQHRQRRGQA